MTTFASSYEAHPETHRYSIVFKTTWQQHTQIQDIATQNGENMADTCRELLTLGLASYRNKFVPDSEKPKVTLLRNLEQVRERQRLLAALSELRADLSEDAFLSYCRALGFEPGEVDEIPPHRGGEKKESRCSAFLRVLFTDRPEGLPAKRVLEIAAQEGFGENLTRKVASDMGFRFQPVSTPDSRSYVWKPPA
jgi:hypothetical protein